MAYNNYIYLYHLDKRFYIPTSPDSITDSLSSKFADTNALGRTAPVFSYVQSGPRTVQVNLDLHRDMMNEVNIKTMKTVDNSDYVDELINALQAIALPRYSGSSVVPPMVAVRLSSQVFIKGVVTSGVTITYKKPIMSDGKYACVSVNFTVSEVDPYDAESALSHGGFRNLTAGKGYKK